MEKYISMLYEIYVTPNIEDEEILECVSTLYRDLTSSQQSLCEKMQKLYASKAFLLGVRTGAELERFLKQDAVRQTSPING